MLRVRIVNRIKANATYQVELLFHFQLAVHPLFCFEYPLDGHVRVETTGTLHFVLVSFFRSLPFFLISWKINLTMPTEQL